MSNKINGRTLDEIKKGLECCGQEECTDCPYDSVCEIHYVTCAKDALACIQVLESELDEAWGLVGSLSSQTEEMASLIERIKRKSNVFYDEIRGICIRCAHRKTCTGMKCNLVKLGLEENCCDECYCKDCRDEQNNHTNWQWRGVQEVE